MLAREEAPAAIEPGSRSQEAAWSLKHVSRKWARFRDKDMLKIKNLKQVA